MRNLAKFLIPLLLIPQICFGAASRSFDGANDHLVKTEYSDLYNATSFTVMSWSTVSNVTADYVLFSTWNGTQGIFIFNDDVGFGSGRTDIWNYRVCEAALTCIAVEGGTGGYSANTWQNTALTFTANNATGMNFYVNGSLESKSPADTTSVADAGGVGAEDIWLGERQTGAQDRNGLIAYSSIWNRVLSAVEMANARWLPESIPDGLLQFNPLWGDSTEIDLSGNARSMTVTGATTSSSGPPVMFAGGLPL